MEIKGADIFYRAVTNWSRIIASVDRRALALMRISLGSVLLLDLFERGSWISAHYSDVGVLPRDFMHRILWEPSYFCMHAWSGSPVWQYVLFVVSAIIAFLLLIGVRTQLMTVLSWLLLVSLHNRNQYLLNGGDQLLRLVLFWSMFLPLGSRYSWDARKNNTKTDHDFASIASLALVIQLVCMYVGAGLAKAGNGDYSFEHVAHMTDLAGPYFNAFVRLSPSLAIGVIIGQLTLPFLLLIPFKNRLFRFSFIGLFACFHIANLLFFRLGVFSWVGLLALLGIWPASAATKPVMSEPSRYRKVALLMLLFYMLFLNIISLQLLHGPRFIMLPAYALRLDQRWNMFSSESMRQAVVVELEGISTANQQLPLNDAYASLRWRNYIYYCPFIHEPEFKENLARFIVSDWNEKHAYSEKISKLRIVENLFETRSGEQRCSKHLLYECSFE